MGWYNVYAMSIVYEISFHLKAKSPLRDICINNYNSKNLFHALLISWQESAP